VISMISAKHPPEVLATEEELNGSANLTSNVGLGKLTQSDLPNQLRNRALTSSCCGGCGRTTESAG
jgi:formate dehydrogenase assembly factor FdhD